MASQAIGIDIGSHAVKIAVLQKKGATTRALRLFRAPLAGDLDPVRVQGALKRAEVSGGPALVGITGRDLIIRYTHVPPVQDWRLRLLMQFEINEVSGQSGGEVAADYRRIHLPVESDDETVLVALARNSWLSPRLDAAHSARLKANGGCPCSVALFNAFLAHGSWTEGETTYLVNIGRENIDMAIQRDGELIFARNITGGGQMFTEAIRDTFGLSEGKAERNKVTKGDLTPKAQARYPDATAEKLANAMLGPAGQLVSMVQSTIMICRAQTKITDLNVDRIVLSGGTARMRGLREYFRANMGVPVEIFDPVGELDLSALDEGDREGLEENPYDFSVAVGLAETQLQPTAFRLEVLTEKAKRTRHFLQRTIWSLGAAAATLVLIVLLFQTRGSAIAEVEGANQALQALKAHNGRIEDDQRAAQAAVGDARRKEVALRARRLASGFGRALLDLLYANHAEGLQIQRLEVQTRRVSLDLLGRPGADRATMGSGDAPAGVLHDQAVWPEAVVDGIILKEFTTDPGGSLNAYYGKLSGAVDDLDVEGCTVEMETTSLDRNNRFRMTFRLVPPAEKAEGEG